MPDHESANTTYTADSPTRTSPTWKGNHKACGGHPESLCEAENGWQLARADDDSEFTVRPIIINRSIEPRARVHYSSMFDDTKEPWSVLEEKGWLPVQGCDLTKMRPSAAVIRKLLEVHERGLRFEQGLLVAGPGGVVSARSAVASFREACRSLRIQAGLEAPSAPVNDNAAKAGRSKA